MAVTQQAIVIHNAVEENKVAQLLYRLAVDCRQKHGVEGGYWDSVAYAIDECHGKVAFITGETGAILK